MTTKLQLKTSWWVTLLTCSLSVLPPWINECRSHAVRDSSNRGVCGSIVSTQIVHSPQAPMHATKDKPAVVNGRIVIRPIILVALTYDDQ